jgi:hypothetical protein
VIAVRRTTVLAMIAVVLGCSTAGRRTLPGDAGSDGRSRADARSDGREPKDARGGDAARARDASPVDAGGKEASRGDGAAHEAGSVDVDSGRPDACDAGAKDARPVDGGTHEASHADAAESGTDAPPPPTTTISLSPLPLEPPFSTAIHDYYVRCAAGTNTLTVSMTAAPGSTIALQQPVVDAGPGGAVQTVEVTENEAIVVGVTADGGTDQYWIRCLPHDFPKMLMTHYPDAGTPTPGYYLVGNMFMAAGDLGYAAAIDGNGVPVWYQATSTGAGAFNVDNPAPGTISLLPYPACNYTFGDVGGEYELYDLVDATTTYVEPSSVPLDVHELQPLPNGDYLVIAAPILTGVDLEGLDSFSDNANMIDCVIQEVDPTGASVWQWTASEHLDPVQDSTGPMVDVVDGVLVADVFHCNSVGVDANGDVLVSARNMDSVFLVSRTTSAILWKMGGATYTTDGAPYLTVTGDPLTTFHTQHDARVLSNGDISMFDDQTTTPGPARAVVYSLDLTAGTATLVWEYDGSVSVAGMGSFRITEDGSRVIGWGYSGPDGRAFTEVDATGNDLLDFVFTDGTRSYRAIKVPTSAFDIALLRSTAGKS